MVLKKRKIEERLSPFIWTENGSIQTKNCVAALLMMAFFNFGSYVRQVWPTLVAYMALFLEHRIHADLCNLNLVYVSFCMHFEQ